jgi:alcohol dehydrogenase
MADLIFKISPHVMLGSYLSARIGQLAQEYGTRSIVIMDPVFKDAGKSENILNSLADRKVDHFVFDEIDSSEGTEVVKQALSLAREGHVHGVIAVGGSKALNIGRATASLFYEPHDVYDFADGAAPSTAPLPLVCIPTTIRAEFLFQDFVPIVDARSKQIKLFKTQNNLLKLALFDPNLTVSLSENQTASMSIETLCIATEAYLSQRASFFSDMLIEKAVELLGYALDGNESLTMTTPQEILLAQGGFLASLGVAISSPGVASLIALGVNARYKISRALTTAILFPYAVEDALQYKSDRLDRIARILRVSEGDRPAQESAALLADNIRQRLALAALPARLKDLSLTIEQLALAAEDIGQLDFMNGLPRSMTADDLFAIIKQAF